MQNQGMSWDPALLRKYSSTGHFRLLNQLKNDLSKRPLSRDRATGELKLPGSQSRSARRGGSARRGTPNTPEPTATPVTLPTDSPESAGSFRQRLSAIDMR